MTVSRYLFNEEEEDLYESLFSDTKRKFTTYVEQGTVLNNYANIFELLTKMRQMVDHPDLVLKKVKPGQIGLPETLVCSICQEEVPFYSFYGIYMFLLRISNSSRLYHYTGR